MRCNHSLIRHEYSSLMIGLPAQLSGKIIDWGKKTIKDDCLHIDYNEISSGRQLDIHITLLYGLYSNNHREVANIFTNIKPFECTLQETSYFENDKFDVSIIKVHSEELCRLNEKLCRTLDFEWIHTCYIPHVTIAYLKSGQARQFAGYDVFQNQKFIVNDIIFSSKTKRKHQIRLGKL